MPSKCELIEPQTGDKRFVRRGSKGEFSKEVVGKSLAADRRTPLSVGAHLARKPPPTLAEGYVTSSAMSAELGHPIALAMLDRGASRKGERIGVYHLGTTVEAEVVGLPFVDPKGIRVHG